MCMIYALKLHCTWNFEILCSKKALSFLSLTIFNTESLNIFVSCDLDHTNIKKQNRCKPFIFFSTDFDDIDN